MMTKEHEVTVTGIGGLFFRSKNPDARAAWYRTHLGVAAGHGEIWHQDPGMTVFAPFPQDSEYFPAEQKFMLNLRVDDLERLVASLRKSGIAVEEREEWRTEYGTFARIHDPEGLPIELWEVPGDESVAE